MDYKFKIIKNSEEETTKIKCFSNNIYCGYILFENIVYIDEFFISDEEREQISEELLDEFFPDNSCIFLSYLEVEENYQNKGIGNLLMNKFFELFNNQKQFNSIFLNACPYLTSTISNKISLSVLVKFYKKFGFEELLDQNTNVLMGLKK